MLFFAVAGFAAFSFVATVYVLYYILIYRRDAEISKYLSIIENIQSLNTAFPHVSVIVNTYNEAKIIRRKIEGISRLDYPIEKLEILVIDDCSADGTGDIAEKALAEFKVNGKVLRNPHRIGLNASLNLAFKEARNHLICVTDSDVLLDRDALKNAVLVLEHFKEAGGVTGKIVPIHTGKGLASISEDSYRFYYDRAMLSESSICSAFPGNGPLMVFYRSSVASSIPVSYGSTDANIAINIVKSGKRFLYVPNALIYEPVPERVGQQKLQKVRRARRLIQVFLHNSDVFGKGRFGKFGTLIFPLKFLMHVVCPLFMFLSAIFVSLYVALSNIFLLKISLLIFVTLFLGFFAFSKRVRSFFISFILHQAYLLAGLLSSYRKSVFWKTIDRK